VAEIVRVDNEVYKIIDFNSGTLTMSLTILHPLKSTNGHSHSYQEIYYFISGWGLLQIGETFNQIKKGFILIPPNSFHKVINNGNEDVEFICTWEN
jgi:mannose-6-phosphate isomerase-like protein (cupin superfamily)